MLVFSWLAFLVAYGLSRYRLQQTAGTRDGVALACYAAGAAVLLLTGWLGGWIQAGVMLLGWFVLPFVTDPLFERRASTRPGEHPNPAAAEQARRMDRLNRGEISLGDYFAEGHADDAEAKRRLSALAARPDIGGVLAKYKVSPARYAALRDKLTAVRDIEWEVLGNPRDLERLIQLAGAAKSDAEIGLALRNQRRAR